MEEEKKDNSNEAIDINYYAKKKESIYDQLNITVKQLDVVIAVLVVLLIAAFVIGALKGNHII